MELHFLGQPYSAFLQQLETTDESKIECCYRGQKYYLRQPKISSETQFKKSYMSAAILKYRGVSYVIEGHKDDEINFKPKFCYS